MTLAQIIHFQATQSRPAKPKGAAWSFLVLPANASAKLPTRSMTTVEGMRNGQPFQAMLEPDGQRSHWLKVSRALRVAAGVEVGDTVELEITPMAVEPERKPPTNASPASCGTTWQRA